MICQGRELALRDSKHAIRSKQQLPGCLPSHQLKPSSSSEPRRRPCGPETHMNSSHKRPFGKNGGAHNPTNSQLELPAFTVGTQSLRATARPPRALEEVSADEFH